MHVLPISQGSRKWWAGRPTAALLLVGLAAVPARADGLPAELRAALDRNVSGIRSLTVTWEQQVRSPIPEQELLKKLGPKEDESLLLTFRMNFFWQEGKFYTLWSKDTYSTVGGKRRVVTNQYEFSFDGQYCYGGGLDHGDMRKGAPQLFIESRKRIKEVFGKTRLFRVDYFQDAGIDWYRTGLTIDEPPRALLPVLVDKGARVTAHQDTGSAVVVELTTSEKVSRYHLDPRRGYAVVRREDRNPAGKLCSVLVNSDFVHLARADVWLPRQCVTQWHTWWSIPDQFFSSPQITTTVKATRLSDETIPDARFALHYKTPGTIVSTDRLPDGREAPERITYRIPARPEDLDQAVGTALEEQVLAPKRRRWQWIGVGVGGAALVGVAGAFYLRRRKARHASGSAPVVFFAALLGLGLADSAAAQPIDPSAVWRTPKKDGVNALYLFLKSHGASPDYSRVDGALGKGPTSLLDLQRAARQLGVSTTLVGGSPEDLRRGPFPVITALEESAEGGRFVLLCGAEGKTWLYVDGADATIREVSEEDFRRHWCGVALEPENPRSAWPAALLGGGLVVTAWGWLRCWKERSED